MTLLAYVFWHQPRPGGTAAVYETLLRAFHGTLATTPPEGFHGSAAFRLPGASWAPPGPVYEDWYLLSDSAALDPLNAAAVSGAHRRPHDTVAAQARWGTAGLYRLRDGAPAFDGIERAIWLSKSPGETYDRFYASIREAAGATGWALWGRQMTLGPAPEFCFHGPDPRLPAGTPSESISLVRLWPISAGS
jgi:hypothetical protein